MYLLEKLNLFKKIDWLLPIIIFILSAIGMAAIYSVDLSRGEKLEYFPTQILAFAVGSVAFIIASSLHRTFYQNFSRYIYIGALILLILVLFFGTTIRGTTGWFRFGGLSFQPAEFAKISVVLILAWLIDRYGRRFDKWQFVVASGLIIFLPVAFILMQPDLGSALILLSLWFVLLFLTRVKKRYIFGIISLGGLLSVLAWFFFFAPYQKERILTFLNPDLDPLGSGYNVTQSIIAIGSGKLFGRGLGFGSQSQLHFLPEAQTDFIFAVISEELGFVAVFLIFALYFLLLWRLISNARKTTDDFSAYALIGTALIFFIHVILNIGAATGLMPVTGITLPFLSYGGTSLVINMALIGIAESISRP